MNSDQNFKIISNDVVTGLVGSNRFWADTDNQLCIYQKTIHNMQVGDY